MVMAINGTLLTPGLVEKLKTSGIQRISISLDGASPQTHDEFRGLTHAFDDAIRGIGYAKSAGLEFQINTTITQTNLSEIPKILTWRKSWVPWPITSFC